MQGNMTGEYRLTESNLEIIFHDNRNKMEDFALMGRLVQL